MYPGSKGKNFGLNQLENGWLLTVSQEKKGKATVRYETKSYAFTTFKEAVAFLSKVH